MNEEAITKPTPKDFQETPSFELFDEVYQLAKKARYEYGEIEFSDFLVSVAFQYKSKLFELQTRKTRLEYAKLLKDTGHNTPPTDTDEDDDISDEEIESIDFNRLAKH